MAIDPSRAAFISNAHRFETRTDNAVRSTYANASEIVLETSYSESDADTLADLVFAANSSPLIVYELEVEGVVDLEDLDGEVPRYILDSDSYASDGRTLSLIGAEIDYEANSTILRVRG